MHMGQRVISADNHIVDPKDLYVERMPAQFRDRAPRVLRGPDGGDGWSFTGEPPSRTFGLEAVAGQASRGEFRPTGLTWDEIMPGNYDGAAHLADMDRDGVDGVVVYPTVAMSAYSLPDRDFALAIIRTYNDWMLDEFEAADRRRLVGLCCLPVDDGMDAAVSEVERCAAKGARGFFLPGMPERGYWEPLYDPLWTAVTDADITVSFHRNHGGRPRGDEVPMLDVPGLNVGGIAARFFSAVTPFTYMIFTGLFERFPTLRVVAGEVNCGWLPFWCENMDQNFEQQRHWAQLPIDRPPSTYVGTNVFVTTLDDREGFEGIRRNPKFADAVMYSIDYPHSVTLWPNSGRHIAELTEGFDDASRAKVLSENAARAYKFAA